MATSIKDYLDNIEDKEMLLKKLSDVLNIEGRKVVIITGVPNDKGGLSMEILQTGHKYRYEVYGFLREGCMIVDDYDPDEEDES